MIAHASNNEDLHDAARRVFGPNARVEVWGGGLGRDEENRRTPGFVGYASVRAGEYHPVFRDDNK